MIFPPACLDQTTLTRADQPSPPAHWLSPTHPVAHCRPGRAALTLPAPWSSCRPGCIELHVVPAPSCVRMPQHPSGRIFDLVQLVGPHLLVSHPAELALLRVDLRFDLPAPGAAQVWG